MGAASWVNTIVGVPTIRNFGSTSGQGSPIVINVLDGVAYYAYKGVVYRFGTGTGGAVRSTPLAEPKE
jgi:hypothetical protein